MGCDRGAEDDGVWGSKGDLVSEDGVELIEEALEDEAGELNGI